MEVFLKTTRVAVAEFAFASICCLCLSMKVASKVYRTLPTAMILFESEVTNGDPRSEANKVRDCPTESPESKDYEETPS